jgi:uncharacterized pyridoxal phosphate-containing UPF0001 family protein
MTARPIHFFLDFSLFTNYTLSLLDSSGFFFPDKHEWMFLLRTRKVKKASELVDLFSWFHSLKKKKKKKNTNKRRGLSPCVAGMQVFDLSEQPKHCTPKKRKRKYVFLSGRCT